MIPLFNPEINSKLIDFFEMSLEEYYKHFLDAVRNRCAKFFLPCFQRTVLPNDYILYGSFKRKSIRDIQLVKQQDGTFKAVECNIKEFRVQRILVRKDGIPCSTQSLLPHLFIVYATFTLRFVLYHLWQFKNMSVSIEAYCLDNDISIPTFKKWLDWLKQNISILREEGLFQDKAENSEIIKNWILEIRFSPLKWLSRSLRLLNLSLFQKHRMPDNTVYRLLKWPD